MVSLFKWNDTFLTNLPEVDEQHKQLVGLINDLSSMLISTDRLDELLFNKARDGIIEYAHYHFALEESLMVENGIDDRFYEIHLAEHRSFLVKSTAVGDLGPNVDIQTAQYVMEFLIEWLAHHILDMDQQMAHQILSIRSGVNPAVAYEQESKRQESRSEPLLTAMTGLFVMVSERNRALRTLNYELENRVTERTQKLQEANEELHTLSVQDELTGLYNRRYADMNLDRLWLERNRYGGGLSVLMIDADHFKTVNDRFGHAQGDRLLILLAERLRKMVRKSDIVCRIGGDEFLIICPRNTYEGIVHLASKIIQSSKPILTEDGNEYWNGSISIGMAEADVSMKSPDDLLLAVDAALYQAKRAGGNCAK
jgi:diguanylate cyclase (GGDEF)-like protein/hemerythrin-like metal-binding protein